MTEKIFRTDKEAVLQAIKESMNSCFSYWGVEDVDVYLKNRTYETTQKDYSYTVPYHLLYEYINAEIEKSKDLPIECHQ